jgi:hypothetical protein
MNPPDVCLEVLVADLTATRGPTKVLVVGRWGDLNTELGQRGADRLDTPPQATALAATLMVTDEADDQWCGRSSSAAKKADAVRRIALRASVPRSPASAA